MDKFDKLFDQYDFSLTDKMVRAEVNEIISENLQKNKTKKVYTKLLSFVDLTSLNTDDTVERIVGLTQKLNDFDTKFDALPHPAAICVYPVFVPVVKDTLSEDVAIATVAGGFPHSQTFAEVKVAETALAVMEGATEIDVVLPVGNFLSGNFQEVYDELFDIKSSCRDAKLKVILETGVLKRVDAIKQAAIIAMAAGADFIKTSTGKTDCGATLEAAYIICQSIKEFNSMNKTKVGFKAAGGIADVEEAVKYYTIVESLLGEQWLSPTLFRIGASRLVNNLLTEVTGGEVKYF